MGLTNKNQLKLQFKNPFILIEFREITKANVTIIIDLAVNDYQEDQVFSNAISIAQGNYNEKAWFRGIYKGDQPIGFVMLYLNHENKDFGVWRFMIDKNYQGKGYGKASMDLIKKTIKEIAPEATKIGLSYVPKEKGGADEFYRKVGFKDTGKMIGKEKLMSFKY